MLGTDAFVMDRVHKFYQLNMEGWTGGEGFPVTPFLDYILVWNTGVSYGFMSGVPQAIIFVVIGAAMAMLALWWFKADELFVRIGLALCLGGALSNALDRILYGAVADFFHLHWDERSFFVFNIADAAISIGAVLLVADFVFSKRETTN